MYLLFTLSLSLRGNICKPSRIAGICIDWQGSSNSFPFETLDYLQRLIQNTIQ